MNNSNVKEIIFGEDERIVGTVERLSEYEFTVTTSSSYFGDDSNIHEQYVLLANLSGQSTPIVEYGRTDVLNKAADILYAFCKYEDKDALYVADLIGDIIHNDV